ncbi:MAG: ArsC/Spx/MgsR family protein [Xanthomarina sp.]
MGSIATNKREVILYYNSETSLGKQAYGYVQASNKKILAIDISKTKITGMEWLEISEKLHIKLSKLINQEHHDFKKNYTTGISLNKEDWIKVLQKHPETLRCPILVNGKVFSLIETPSEIAKHLETEENPKNHLS